MMPVIALWLVNLALDTGGQLAFKAAALRPSAPEPAGWLRTIRDPFVRAGLACYGAEFVGWLAFLTLGPLSTAVLLSSINIATVALGGRLVFGEPGGPLRTTGIVLVALGVALAGAGAAR